LSTALSSRSGASPSAVAINPFLALAGLTENASETVFEIAAIEKSVDDSVDKAAPATI